MSYFVAPAAQSILDEATEIAPDRSTASDGTVGDLAHQARRSDHNPDDDGEVLAADLTHDPAHGIDAHAWADRTRLRCKAGKEKRVTYQISNRRIYSENSGWEWVPYTGENPHEKHVHTSINKAHADDTSDWGIADEEFTVADIDALIGAIANLTDAVKENTTATRSQHQKDRRQAARLSQAEGRIDQKTADRIVAAIEAED